MAGQNTGGWKLLEPITIGAMKLKNRMVMSPMLTCLATHDGGVTEELLAYYSERARGGIGAIISEYCSIDSKESRARAHQLGAHSDDFIPGLSKLAETIRSGGAKAILQICHAGRQTRREYMGRQPLAPSPVPNLGEMPRELTIAEIEGIQNAFAEAAGRVKQAGFDGVELHGANGYLLSQFLAPFTNRRTDKYGNGLENRSLFALETVKKVREKVGDQFTVGYRMNGSDFIPDGLTAESASRFAGMLEKAGVDYVHVSGGIQESWQYMVQPMYVEKALLVPLAAQVKKVVGVPVVTVGSLNVETAEKALRENKADLVAFGRSMIADPELPRKLATGKEEDIRPCIRGNEGCISNTSIQRALRCEVNPAAGREADFRVTPAPRKKAVVVIGGGIAGMEAARLASVRGHEVLLIEKGEALGGHLLEASVPAFKDEVKRLITWSINQLQKGAITIRLKTEATLELIRELKPDALIVALGSSFIAPMVPNRDRPFVTFPDDVLLGKKTVGDRAVVVGAGVVGCETALYIREELKGETLLVEEQDEILPEGTVINKSALTERLDKSGIKIHVGWRMDEIVEGGGIVCRDKGGERQDVEADTVVLALGLQAKRELAEAFKNLAPQVHIIGDCNEARDIYHAFEDAWQAVLQI